MIIYDATWQTEGSWDKDDLVYSRNSLGLEHCPLIMMANGGSVSSHTRDWKHLRDNKQDAIKACIDAALASNAIICINQERWTGEVNLPQFSDAEQDIGHDFYREVAKLYDSAVKVGHYGIPTFRHDHDKKDTTWIRRLTRLLYDRLPNGRFSDFGVNDVIDVYFPSLYYKGFPSDPEPGLKRRVDLCKALAKYTDKTIIPVCWHGKTQAHINHNGPILVELCRRIKTFVKGVALWRHPDEAWGGSTGIIPDYIREIELI